MPEERADVRFRPHQHLRRSRDFHTVRQMGRRINCGAFLLQVLVRTGEDADIPGPRLGVITSRRVGPSVQRNRLRRRMREIFRHNQGALGGCTDLVVVMRSSATRVPIADLEARFLKGLLRGGLPGGDLGLESFFGSARATPMRDSAPSDQNGHTLADK